MPAPIRAQMIQLADRWKDRDIWVAMSGNFTAERTLAHAGLKGFHSNDVSLYSCAIGYYLTKQPMYLSIANPDVGFVSSYLDEPSSQIATLMLLLDHLPYSRRTTIYHERMWNGFIRHFEELHEKTVNKIEKALEGVELAEFYAGDAVDWVKEIPEEAAVLTFPPTYGSQGYNRLYRWLDAAFEWDRPYYQDYDDARAEQYIDDVCSRKNFYLVLDQVIDRIAQYRVGNIQTGPRKKPLIAYARYGGPRVVFPHTATEPVRIPPVTDTLKTPLRLKHLSQGQFAALRSKYLSRAIMPADPSWRFAITTADERLVGCIGISRSTNPWTDAYVMSDFATDSAFKRLSKLVVAVLLTTELRDQLEQKMGQRIRTVGTTAFTEKKVSMKYRGLLELYSRKEGQLNYLGMAGKWSLAEATEWWLSRYGTLMKAA